MEKKLEFSSTELSDLDGILETRTNSCRGTDIAGAAYKKNNKKKIKKAKAMMLIVIDKRKCDELNLTFKILDPS